MSRPKPLTGTLADFRDDAAIRALTPEQFEELKAVILAGASWSKVKEWLQGHGLTLGPANVKNVRDKITRAADRLIQRSATLKALREVAEKNGITLTGAALEQAVVSVGDLLDASVDPNSEEGQQLLLQGLSGLTGARSVEIADKRVNQQGKALELATKKFQFNAAAAALKHLPALRKIAADKSLDDQARVDAARRALFGQLPEAA
jgi:hypothetical protein